MPIRAKPLPSAEYLRSILDYDPESGSLTWKSRGDVPRKTNTRLSGRLAGAVSANGYRYICIHQCKLLAHRVAWKMIHGEDPEQIDHINGDRVDNRAANLRSCSARENSRNRRLPSVNTSGVIGVTFANSCGGWVSQIGAGGQMIYLGYYEDFHMAVIARKLAEESLGFHPNHGRTGPVREAA